MPIPRHEVVPLADQQVSLRVDGAERVRWHSGPNDPRPCFFPLFGPSGQPLTRMGHPGAPNHDHHQSIWFAHHKVLGINFWGNGGPARIRQKEWLVYDDGDVAARMAVRLGWFDGHDPRELLEQDVIAVLRSLEHGETWLEIQTTFRPIADSLEFGKTNFGFFAVRVAKSLSVHFGGGQLTNSAGAVGEPAIFGNPATWVDYSGPVYIARDGGRVTEIEGITYFDHPSNPRHPAHWHVREDGWMGASVCMHEPLVTSKDQPLSLRYLLHAHRGPVNRVRAETIAREFATAPRLSVQKSARKHTQYELLPSDVDTLRGAN